MEILKEISRLREIGARWRSGDQFHCSFAHTLDAIVETITQSNGALYDIASYRERKRQQYADGLDYNAIKKLKITKEHIFALFRDPRTGEIPSTNRAHISIEWCTYPPFQQNWMDRWYMVFDVPPHNNRELPLYFLRKLYAEFMLGKHVNYFDILEFQGVGLGMPQNRPNVRHGDANCPAPPPRRQLPKPDVPLAHHLIPHTQEAFLSLAKAIVRHSTIIERMDQEGKSLSGGVQPSSSGGARSSSSEGRPTHHETSIEAHECSVCGCACYGRVLTNVTLTRTLSQKLDDSAEGQGSGTSDAPLGGEIDVPVSIGGFHMPGVVVSSTTTTCTELDPQQGQNSASSDPTDITHTGFLREILDSFAQRQVFGTSDAPFGGETFHTEASIENPVPSLSFASPLRPAANKGRVYVRRSSLKEITGVHDHEATDSMYLVGELSMPDLTGIIDATISATSMMATSHTKSTIAERASMRRWTPQTSKMQNDLGYRHDRSKSRENKRKIEF